ncbi:hypothetical protein KFU94_11570 [Chloroflexi bacterium TSY]|nr:hypothetical protein [Chloroflexi bacterium TSY]
MNRFELIARKQEIRSKIEQVRRTLEHERKSAADQRSWLQRRRIAKLETELDMLMSKEYNLRLQIDRNP